MQGSGREQVVPARPASAPLVSLLTSVPAVVYDDPHLSEGIAFEGETCGNGAVTAGACAPSAALPNLSSTHGSVYAAPVLIHAGDQCAPFQIEARDPRGRALRLLDAVTAQDLEAELWDGTVARAKSYLNPFLRNPATVVDLTPVGGAVRPRAALATLEQALSKSRTRPVIHATVEGAYYLPEVRLDGQVWLTKKQTIVVPGSGYSGLGPVGATNETPAAGETWLFGTGLVDVRLSPAWTTPDTDVEAIDRDVNTARFRAMRLGVATFDPCLHFAVRMQFAANEDQAETPNAAA